MHPSARLLAGSAAFPVKVEIKMTGFNVLSVLGICDASDKTASVGPVQQPGSSQAGEAADQGDLGNGTCKRH